MKSFSKTQRAVLDLLSDGKCHSGNSLGEQLGISRTAVWKQISQLSQVGLAIQRMAHQGYQLNQPLILLDQEKINCILDERGFQNHPEITLFASVDSTNRYLRDLPSSSQIRLCAAETQTQGRGRFGRDWQSPFAENICFSQRLQMNCCLSRLSSLSLVIGLAIIRSLERLSVIENIGIKWPNDILWKDKKLCGILIEVLAESNGNTEVIIGIGMNVNTDTLNTPLENSAWCSLYEITGTCFDRNKVIAELFIQTQNYVDRFLNEGFEPFLVEWKSKDYLAGKMITISQPMANFRGLALGVNDLGQLCIEDNEGRKHYLSSGDTSVNQKMQAART